MNAFAIVGLATELGIDQSVRHGADLGYIPVVVRNACFAGHCEAGERAIATLEYLGDALFTGRGRVQQPGYLILKDELRLLTESWPLS